MHKIKRGTMSRVFRHCLLGLVGAVVTVAVDARSDCDENWMCVETEESEQSIDLYVRNYTPFPITVTVRAVRKRNLRASNGDTATRTVAGGGREHVLQLLPVDTDRRTSFRVAYDWTVGHLSPDHDDDYLYRLPYAKGKKYWVIQGYGSRFSHTGLEEYTVDFDMSVGTPVYAAREGVVAQLEDSHSRGCWGSGCSRYANYLVILHPDGTTGEYYHLKRNGVVVELGHRVERGQLIAYSGNTGHTTMPHLHFGVYRADTWGRTQSLQVKFQTSTGVINRIRAGRVYEVE